MGKKKQEQEEPPYTVLVPTGPCALNLMYMSHDYNSEGSRVGISTLAELAGLKVKVKEGKESTTVNSESSEILASMLAIGWERADKFVTTTVGTNAKERTVDANRLKKEHAANLKELETIQLWKGEKGRFSYKGKDVDIDHDDLVAEWRKTFPEKIGKVNRFDHKDFEVVIAGNRGLTFLVIRNCIVRKAGFPQDVITHIERVKRGFATAQKRNDNATFLNEIGKLGKLESSPRQKQGKAFQLREKGRPESDLRKVLAVKAGGVGRAQALWAPADLLYRVRFVLEALLGGAKATGLEAYATLKAELLSGAVALVKQGDQLKACQQRRNMFGHSDGLTDAFTKAGPGKRGAYGANSKTKLNPAELKVFVRDNPVKVGQAIIDYFENRKDPKWDDPMVEGKATSASSMSSTDVTNVAANCSEMVEVLLNTMGGIETGHELADVAAIVNGYRPPLYPCDDEGEEIPDSEPLTQKDVKDDAILRGQLKKAAAKKTAGKKKTG